MVTTDTALPPAARTQQLQKPTITVPEGFWVRDSGHASRPISHLARSFYLEISSAAATAAFTEFGLLLERVDVQEIGGWTYLRIVPIGGKEGPTPPAWLFGLLVRVVPPLRAAVARARQAQEKRLGDAYIDRWWEEWRDDFLAQIHAIRSVDLQPLANQALVAHLERALAFLEQGAQVHFKLFVPYMQAVTALVFFCEEHLGWDTDRVNELTIGLSERSTEPARRLSTLATRIRANPHLQQILQEPDDSDASDDDVLARLRTADVEIAQGLDDFLRRFGHRSLDGDIAQPTLGEQPNTLLAMLRGQVTCACDPETVAQDHAARRQTAAEAARTALADRPARLAEFDRILSQASRAYPVREDNVYATFYDPLGLLRLAVLEAGRRLQQASVITEPDDIFYLYLDEIKESLLSGIPRQESVAVRRAEYRWAEANVGPRTYGKDPGPPPPLHVLPAPARHAMRSLFWFLANDVDVETADNDQSAGTEQGLLQGIGASAGHYTGPVRIIQDEGDFHRLQPGDVLVCPITSPVWSLLFAQAGALVTDKGGLLSHPAIVAREFGLPAVLATGNGTTVLQDGQLVTVDGVSGRVQIHHAATPNGS